MEVVERLNSLGEKENWVTINDYDKTSGERVPPSWGTAWVPWLGSHLCGRGGRLCCVPSRFKLRDTRVANKGKHTIDGIPARRPNTYYYTSFNVHKQPPYTLTSVYCSQWLPIITRTSWHSCLCPRRHLMSPVLDEGKF